MKLPKIVRDYPDASAAVAAGVGAAVLVAGAYAVVSAIRGGWPPLGDVCSFEVYEDVLGRHSVGNETAGRAWSYMPWVRYAAVHFGISPALLAGLVHTESAWNADAGSSAGATGLAQFISSTASSVRGKLIARGDWPFGELDRTDPQQSLWLSAALLSSMLRDHDVDWTLAAYNAGPTAANRPSSQWPQETQAYVPSVLRHRDWYEEIDALCRDGWG